MITLIEMAAIAFHQFADCITCHAWSPDQSMLALCPNNNEVHIYKLVEESWERIHVLQKHDQIIVGIDWSKSSNRIVTVSHDRNSYVWNEEGSLWVPTLVILRLNRAALCVQWSPKGNKFAVGSGAKTVCICYYEQENNWWVSKLIRKRHDSSVTSVAWHPNNVLIATTSTDGKCRVFSTFIKGVDAGKPKKSGSGSLDAKFGEQIVQLDLSYCWAFGVKWSPSGNSLAYVGHNSMIYFVDQIGPSPLAQSVTLRDLPLRDVMFVSEKLVIGAGFDCNPMVFAADGTGLWSFVRYLDEKKTTSSSGRYGSQFTEAFGKFYGSSKQGTSNDKGRAGVHDNCITCIVPLKKSEGTKLTSFSTSGLDGKVVIWDLKSQEDLLEYL
uniref:Actin-related protein 2/3 complex subunit n=2 Tax=Helianthus annuus TaxID=4232 RepID=A0A251S1U5_HELAN